MEYFYYTNKLLYDLENTNDIVIKEYVNDNYYNDSYNNNNKEKSMIDKQLSRLLDCGNHNYNYNYQDYINLNNTNI